MKPCFRTMLLLLLLPLSVAGCETAGKIGKVIKDPGIQVGAAEDQPSRIALHAFAAAEVNKNFDGEPSPVVVKVFALSGDHRFFSYDFFSVAEFPEEALGVTFKELLDESMLEPDSYRILGPYELPKGTKKIGVLAEYLDIEATNWRSSIPVQATGADERLLLLLLEEEVRLVREK